MLEETEVEQVVPLSVLYASSSAKVSASITSGGWFEELILAGCETLGEGTRIVFEEYSQNRELL